MTSKRSAKSLSAAMRNYINKNPQGGDFLLLSGPVAKAWEMPVDTTEQAESCNPSEGDPQ